MTDWNELSARGGRVGHDVVGWIMWDERAKAGLGELGFPNTGAWVVAWRLAGLGGTPAPVAAAMTYSIHPAIIDAVRGAIDGFTTDEAVLGVLDDAIVPGLESIAPGLAADLGELADGLWAGVDTIFHGMRPFFSAFRALPRPADRDPGLSAWHAINCIRELRGDNHWALLASEGIDDVEAGLLHSAMIDVEEYGDEEWIARSRGGDDESVAAAWSRLEARGLATDGRLSDEGRALRLDLERRTDALTAPVWQAIGETTTVKLLELVEPHQDAFVQRINETAGPRWMPAVRPGGSATA
ncbi:MAG: hypothetical protein AAGE98_15220 [Actinomycetota bacterium]